MINSAEKALREGMERNIGLPEIVVKKLLPQFQFHIVDDVSESIYANPINNSTLSDVVLAAIKEEYLASIAEEIITSYRVMYDFLLSEYLPNARKTVGLTDLPDGKSWYEYQIKVNTTLDYTAKELHQLGLQEVAPIVSEMTSMKEQIMTYDS